MKKSLIILLSVSVVMLFAVSAFALHAVPERYEYTPGMVKAKAAQIEIGGHIRIRGEYDDNYTDFLDDIEGDNTRSSYNQRARVHLKATVSPNTLGLIEFEANSSQTSDSYGWASCPEGAKGIYQVSNCKPTGVTVRQAYIAHQANMGGAMAGFKAGHQLYALGNGLFFNHTQFGDDGITLWISPSDGMEISLNALKFSEGSSAFADDADAYIGTFSGAFGPANVSADITYVNDNRATADAPNGLDFYNLGARAEFNAGPAKIRIDGEYQMGTAEDAYMNPTGGLEDFDLSGYAFLVGADINAGPVTITVEGAYGSGDDVNTPDEYEGFVTSLSDGDDYTYLYDQKAKTAGQGFDGAYLNSSRTGLNNTWYISVGASAKAGPDVKVIADVFYLQASEEVSTVTNYDETDIGIEIDGKIEYQIDSNLVYYVEGGYLIAGDFYKNVTGPNSPDPLNPEDADDAYSVRHGIILKF